MANDADHRKKSYADGELPADAPVPLDPNFRIELPGFEGPLDLLLYLIKKHELDVLDLPVAFVTEKYLEYLELMEELNLDLASEYLVMAATLAHIKSKTLLPKDPNDSVEDADEEEQDPRAELIRRLLEYQKYKKAAEQLTRRGVAGRDVFPRGIPAPKAEGEAPLAELSVFKLIDAFSKLVKKRQGQLSLEVDAERITIQERIGQVVESLKRHERVSFVELFDGYAATYDLVVTFLALLEMAKMRMIRVYQTGLEETIYVEYRVVDEGMGPRYGEVALNVTSDAKEEEPLPVSAPEPSEEPSEEEEEFDVDAWERERTSAGEVEAPVDPDVAWAEALAAVGEVELAEEMEDFFGDETESETETESDARSDEARSGAAEGADALETDDDSEQDGAP